MLIKTKILFVALILSKMCISQQRDSLTSQMSWDRGVSMEVFHQKNYGIALGGIVGKHFGDKMSHNFSVGIYGDVFFMDHPIVAPRVKLNLNHLGNFGINVNFANNFRQGQSDFRITPEVNFSMYGIANLFLGYSIPVGATTFDDLSRFRLGLNVNITHKE